MSFARFAAGFTLLVSSPAYAQDCASYALFHQGTSMTVTAFDAKGKEASRTVSTVKSASPTDGGVTAEVHAEISDPKGKATTTADYTATCTGGEVAIDMDAYLPTEQTQAYKDFDMKLEGGNLAYPAAPTAGQALPDGTLHIVLTAKDAAPGTPMSTVTMDVALKNRKVVGQESVTTPAGTFDAWKIEYDNAFSMKTVVAVNTNVHTVEWYVPGIGPVKSETTGKNGKVMGSTQLTALSK